MNDNMMSGAYNHYQMFQAKKSIEKLEEKIDRLYEKYDEVILQELKNG